MPQVDDVQKALSDIAAEIRSVAAEQAGLAKKFAEAESHQLAGVGAALGAERTVLVQRLEAAMRHLTGVIPRV